MQSAAAIVGLGACSLLSGCGGAGGSDASTSPTTSTGTSTAATAPAAMTTTTPGGKHPFACPALAEVPEPTDVWHLHPSHVGLVAAVGDSITAGFSAKGDVLEARELSFSMGEGSGDQLTLPWLLQRYSSDVQGMSNESRSPMDIAKLPSGDYHPDTDNLNVAETNGAAFLGSVDEQWAYLSAGLRRYPDAASRWKVLTYWMFANDVLDICDGPAADHPHYTIWEQKTEEFLANVSSSLTKVYVSLVPMLTLSQIRRIALEHPGASLCSFTRSMYGGMRCFDSKSDAQVAQLDANVDYMNTRLHKFAADWQAKLRDQARTDVAIVVQPFTEGLGKELDASFVSSMDCFHPSAAAHESLAIGLWNSMLRESDATEAFAPGDAPKCPTESSVFYTGSEVTLV